MKRKVERVVSEDKSFCDECGKEVSLNSKFVYDDLNKHFCCDDCASWAFKKSFGKKLVAVKKVVEPEEQPLDLVAKSVSVEVVKSAEKVSKIDKDFVIWCLVMGGVIVLIVILFLMLFGFW